MQYSNSKLLLNCYSTDNHALLVLPNKCRAIKEFVVCWALIDLIHWVFGQKIYIWLLDLTLKCHGQQPQLLYEEINR